LQESFLRGQGASISRYFFGDGLPNGGIQAVDAIIKLLKNRASPESNPVTFISCTNEDEAVEVSIALDRHVVTMIDPCLFPSSNILFTFWGCSHYFFPFACSLPSHQTHSG
jgi:hypothetical protein